MADVPPCSKCGSVDRKKYGNGWQCRPCNKAARQRWVERNPEKYKANMALHNAKSKANGSNAAFSRLKNYGVTQEHYDELLRVADNKCLVCHSANRLSIDHDHATGRVRGILCARCNTALGMMNENPAAIRALATYMERNMA